MENEILIGLTELVPAVQKKLSEKARFCTATCLDVGDQFELLYHFEPEAAVVPLATLRLKMKKDEDLPSISGIYPCAVIAENEIAGDFKVRITGLPLDFKGTLMHTRESIQFPLTKTPPVPKTKVAENKIPEEQK
jgi:hypothetical protein